MAASKSFSFSGKLEPADGVLAQAAVFLPKEVIKELPKGRVRAKGTFNQAAFALGVQYKKDGARFFVVSHVLRKAAGIRMGDRVEVKFKLVDPEKVDLPEELEAVLTQDDEGLKAWNTIKPGLQRGIIHFITSTKNIDLRIKRAIQLVDRAKTGTLHSQTKKRNKRSATGVGANHFFHAERLITIFNNDDAKLLSTRFYPHQNMPFKACKGWQHFLNRCGAFF